MVNAVKTLDKHKYEVYKDKIGYKDFDIINTNSSYGYLTTFAYYKEFDNNYI